MITRISKSVVWEIPSKKDRQRFSKNHWLVDLSDGTRLVAKNNLNRFLKIIGLERI